MRDLRSDWKRWSHAERMSAAALVVAFIICGSSVVGVLTGGPGARPVFLHGTNTVEGSGTHGPVSLAPVHQAQSHYFFSEEDKFLNSMMVRAYTSGDTESLKELLLYWQDVHSTAL
jgi:hypothetical protein